MYFSPFLMQLGYLNKKVIEKNRPHTVRRGNLIAVETSTRDMVKVAVSVPVKRQSVNTYRLQAALCIGLHVSDRLIHSHP